MDLKQTLITLLEKHSQDEIIATLKAIIAQEKKDKRMLRKEYIYKLHQSGLTNTQIGSQCGVTPERIKQIINSYARFLRHPSRAGKHYSELEVE